MGSTRQPQSGIATSRLLRNAPTDPSGAFAHRLHRDATRTTPPSRPTTLSSGHCGTVHAGPTTASAWSAVNVSPTPGIRICHQVFGHGSRLAAAGFWLDGRQAGHTSAKGRMDNAS